MKSVIVAFICVLYCCQAAVTRGVVIDGKNEKIPEVTIITTESSKLVSPVNGNGTKTETIPIGPTIDPNTSTVTPTTTHAPNITTIAPNTTTIAPTTTHAPNTTTVTPTTTHAPNTTTVTTTHAPNTTTVAPTTPKPTNGTTVTPSPSSTASPITSTTAVPPSNRGFDGPSFIGGIVLASGLMAIGFVALKFYRARTELNYHTL
ncbi:threonine-rich protein-like isoform X2 [Harmonia axyridis]|uniref:threonine-rich protein-like isoform X2 n=1 Tax=Harmonia axyridis TaxID=115357 RepID=UPI001E27927A|nr:threonine-rich protein-like isoform X2 [Harmonia axyridis]